MKIAAFAQIRNEADIAPLLLRHFAALYDFVVLLDHGSCDGTSAILAAACEARSGWAYWRCDVPGYHQIAFASFALDHVFKTTDAEFVVIHDADEFVDVADRGALEGLLAKLTTPRSVGLLNWRNCVPTRFGEWDWDTKDGFWFPPPIPGYYKVVIPRRFIDATGGLAVLTMGNHTIEPNDGGTVAYQTIGDMLHFPVRSRLQIEQKAVTGTLSNNLRADRKETDGVHCLAMVNRFAEGRMSEGELIALAVDYGNPGAECGHLSYADLSARGFIRRTMDFALTPPPANSHREEPPNAWQVMASLLLQAEPLNGAALDLYLEDGHLLARAQNSPGEDGLEPRCEALALVTAQRDAAAQEVAVLKASHSFRLTAPLRALRRFAAARGSRRQM